MDNRSIKIIAVHKVDYARKMLKGDISDHRVLPWLYTQDSTKEIYEDQSTWQKSNPRIGVVKLNNYLEDVMNKSKHELSTRVTMLCKDFSIKQADSGSWLSFDDLNNEDKYSIDDLRDSYAIGGVDLSSTTDLTAAVLVIQKRDSNKKFVIPHFFMPSEVVDKRIKEDNVPYDIWIKKECLLVLITEES